MLVCELCMAEAAKRGWMPLQLCFCILVQRVLEVVRVLVHAALATPCDGWVTQRAHSDTRKPSDVARNLLLVVLHASEPV